MRSYTAWSSNATHTILSLTLFLLPLLSLPLFLSLSLPPLSLFLFLSPLSFLPSHSFSLCFLLYSGPWEHQGRYKADQIGPDEMDMPCMYALIDTLHLALFTSCFSSSFTAEGQDFKGFYATSQVPLHSLPLPHKMLA